MLKTLFVNAQGILAVLLIFSILIQAKGVGLGQTFGGGGGFYSSRRGVEKFIFRLTIIFVSLFFAVSAAVHLI